MLYFAAGLPVQITVPADAMVSGNPFIVGRIARVLGAYIPAHVEALVTNQEDADFLTAYVVRLLDGDKEMVWDVPARFVTPLLETFGPHTYTADMLTDAQIDALEDRMTHDTLTLEKRTTRAVYTCPRNCQCYSAEDAK